MIEKKQRLNDSLSNNNLLAEDEMDTQEPMEELSRLLPDKKQAPSKTTKSLAANGPILNLSWGQYPQSCSPSLLRENGTNTISPQKNLAMS